jgi:DNA-binding protein HU-beta
MNKDQLATVVASEVGLSQSDAKSAVDAVFDGITNGMKNGDKVSIAGFGQFESRYSLEQPRMQLMQSSMSPTPRRR